MTDKLSLGMDGQEITSEPGKTLLEIAREMKSTFPPSASTKRRPQMGCCAFLLLK